MRPYTLSPISTTGARPHAPTHLNASSENLPSEVVCPTSMPSSFLKASNTLSAPLT